MRTLTLSLAAVIALVACGGPSTQEITTAKQARYEGDKSVLFRTAKAAAEEKSKIANADEAALGFQTVGRWYTTDGILAPGSDEDYKNVPDKSIRVTLVVRLVPDADKWIVQVEPSMLRRISGSPQPQKVEPNDPSVPGYVQGQVDAMQFTIWKALQQYQVKTPGGIAPATAPAPATDPAAGSAAPDAGSAAPAPATP
ncbi:MAG: hypothetical protein ACKV2T_42400 [Kofleriaceae bacterium]